jgi:hypothetical protein
LAALHPCKAASGSSQLFYKNGQTKMIVSNGINAKRNHAGNSKETDL